MSLQKARWAVIVLAASSASLAICAWPAAGAARRRVPPEMGRSTTVRLSPASVKDSAISLPVSAPCSRSETARQPAGSAPQRKVARSLARPSSVANTNSPNKAAHCGRRIGPR